MVPLSICISNRDNGTTVLSGLYSTIDVVGALGGGGGTRGVGALGGH